MANNIDKDEKETSLIRVSKRAKDIVQRTAFEKKITIKEYVEQLIFKAEEETQNTKRKDWKGNPFLDKFIPNKNKLSKYWLCS